MCALVRRDEGREWDRGAICEGALAGGREGQPGLRGDLRVVAAWAICKGELWWEKERDSRGLRGDLCVGLRGRFARDEGVLAGGRERQPGLRGDLRVVAV